MQLSQSTSMRQDMRQMLTPRMIQSMEILQLPLMALEERIEQELQSNPVLEVRDSEEQPTIEDRQPPEEPTEGEQMLGMKEDGADDFERLNKIGEFFENEEFNTNTGTSFRQGAPD